ncbi:T9SS type A sorting domain-containing protein [Kaistella sp.]|uniref:T9SS type A sorting domain-containing protein n=1 Tax=Kaistella sp. TaxID=2782235 RepID=UPI003C56B486
MKNSDIATIKIYNTKGFLVKEIKGVKNLETSELKPGYYLVEFLNKNNQVKREFIELKQCSKISSS